MSDLEPDPVRVLLDGTLTVRTVATVRTTLLQALAEHQAVEVDCTAAETIDLSLIQTLFSLTERASAR